MTDSTDNQKWDETRCKQCGHKKKVFRYKDDGQKIIKDQHDDKDCIMYLSGLVCGFEVAVTAYFDSHKRDENGFLLRDNLKPEEKRLLDALKGIFYFANGEIVQYGDEVEEETTK